jgi:hypothetical protein
VIIVVVPGAVVTELVCALCELRVPVVVVVVPVVPVVPVEGVVSEGNPFGSMGWTPLWAPLVVAGNPFGLIG